MGVALYSLQITQEVRCMHTTKPRQFVCIDAGVEDRQSLLSGISDDAVIHILSDASDGLQQVASLLAHEQNIAALHIISTEHRANSSWVTQH